MTHNSLWHFCLATIIFSLALMVPTPVAAKITDLRVSVDKNPIMVDEAVQLIISAEGEIKSQQIDLSALDKDFRRSSTSISQSTRSINFNTTKTTTWVTQLFPKSVGTFTIPSFEMDGQKSNAFELTVNPVGNGQGASARDFYVTADIDMKTAYLQQQIKYTTRLYIAKEIQRGSLQAPELENAIVKQVGEDKEYEDFQNGVRYRVIERTYAIIPQASGSFSIVGSVFNGEALTDSRQSFGFISRTKPINRVAPSIELTVLPIPNDYQDHWLPSEFVQLNEEWQQDPKTIVLGQPITRTITLTAAGLVEEQLPNIAGMYPPDFKTYPDQASTSTVNKGTMLFAQKIQSEAIIPNRVGNFVIGEVVVPWFNVVTKQTEYAKLPARSVEVIPPTADMVSNIEAISPANQNPSTSDSPINDNKNTSTLLNNEPLNDSFRIDWLHISLFVLWISSLGIFTFIIRLVKRRDSEVSNNNTLLPSDESSLWNALQKAVSLHNISETNQTLTAWLSELTGEPVQSITQCFAGAKANDCLHEYNRMMASTYSSSTENWEADTFISSLASFRQKALRVKQEKDNQFALYPKT